MRGRSRPLVMKEVPVFDGHDGVDQHQRKFRKRYHVPFLAARRKIFEQRILGEGEYTVSAFDREYPAKQNLLAGPLKFS